MRMQIPRRPGAFTLIELLVVILIIAVLAAILIPVIIKARIRSLDVTCANNQRQLAMAISIYTQDNGEQLPDANTWAASIKISDQKTFKCPLAGRNNSYVYNAALSQALYSTLLQPSQTLVTADGMHIPANNPSWALGLQAWFSAGTSVTTDPKQNLNTWAQRFKPYYTTTLDMSAQDICFADGDITYRHPNKAYMSFLDGHVAANTTIPSPGGTAWTTTLSNSGANEPASSPPVLVANGLATQPVIRFTATSYNCLQSATGFGVDFNRHDFSLVMVRNMDQSPNGNVPAYTILSAPGQVIRGELYDANPLNMDEEGFTPTPSTCMWVLTVSNGTYQTYSNGVIADSNGTIQRAPTAGVAPIYLGRDLNNWVTINTLPASMDIAELMIFNRALTAQDVSAIHGLFAGKYGLP